MLARIFNWFDHRTGYRKLIEVLLIEHIPGGAKWRYVWGSCLAFVFTVQLLTGLLLMTAYSPGDSTAWASVYWIQYQMDFGWLIRGLHHFGSQAMVVLLGIHMLQVVIAGAHLPPREVNWWLGLLLLASVLGLSLTGYLLPWDQKGYWATQVATNIAGNLPHVGPWLQKIVVGGPVYGHHTLTRFYTLHVGVLPPLIVALMIAHIAVFRRHGVTTPRNAQGEGWFWPDQAFRDMIASIAVFAIMLSLALGLLGRHGHTIDLPDKAAKTLWDRCAHAGRDGLGANLDAPADPSRAYPARPEWYFLFLFQLLKYFEGEREIIGTVIIPAAAGLVLFVMPFLGHGRMRPVGHVVGVVVVVGLLAGIGSLTCLAIAGDTEDRTAPHLSAQEISRLPEKEKRQAERNEKARAFNQEMRRAEQAAERAIQLAGAGIPSEGAVYLLRRDPMTQGADLFGQYCAGCHRYGERYKSGDKASDLFGFGTKDWIGRLLANPGHDDFFGRTGLRKMDEWVKENLAELSAEEKDQIERIVAWLANHPRSSSPNRHSQAFQQGLDAFKDMGCVDCHRYEDEQGSGIYPAPDLTGYGDAEYIRLMIMSPGHSSRYGTRNRMPLFRDLEGPAAEITRQDLARTKRLLDQVSGNPDTEGQRTPILEAMKLVHLGDIDRELIIRWILGDDRVVFGGEPITAPAQ